MIFWAEKEQNLLLKRARIFWEVKKLNFIDYYVVLALDLNIMAAY